MFTRCRLILSIICAGAIPSFLIATEMALILLGVTFEFTATTDHLFF
jgi:hypothetical protein